MKQPKNANTEVVSNQHSAFSRFGDDSASAVLWWRCFTSTNPRAWYLAHFRHSPMSLNAERWML
jgi:hypothetical protein